MTMKKIRFLLILSSLMLAGLGSALWAAEPGEANEKPQHPFVFSLGFNGGTFFYVTTDNYPAYKHSDPMIETSCIFEYRFLKEVGIGAYFNLRGYKWSTITSDDPAFGQIYGAPGIAFGGMAFWHLLPPSLQPFDLCLAAGLGCNIYIESGVDGLIVNPGLDITSELTASYAFTPNFSAGLRGCLRRSMHGELDTIRPYDLWEANIGALVKLAL